MSRRARRLAITFAVLTLVACFIRVDLTTGWKRTTACVWQGSVYVVWMSKNPYFQSFCFDVWWGCVDVSAMRHLLPSVALDSFGFFLRLPLWVPAPLAAIVSVWAHRRETASRRRYLECEGCGYPLAQLVRAVDHRVRCPECGHDRLMGFDGRFDRCPWPGFDSPTPLSTLPGLKLEPIATDGRPGEFRRTPRRG